MTRMVSTVRLLQHNRARTWACLSSIIALSILDANREFRKILRIPLFSKCSDILLRRVCLRVLYDERNSDNCYRKHVSVQLPITIIHPVYWKSISVIPC